VNRTGGTAARSRARPWPRTVGVFSVLALAGWLWSSIFLQVREGEATVVYPAFEVSAEPLMLAAVPGQVIRGTVRPGQSVYGVLSRYGLDQSQVAGVVRAARPVADLNRVQVNQAYRVRLDAARHFRTFELDISPTRMLRVSVTPFGYVADSTDIAFENRPVALSGTADASLFGDLVGVPGGAELVQRLYDVFAWEVDFRRDIRPQDTYRILVDEVLRDGRFERFGTIRFAQVQTQGRTVEALYYNGEYYDADGRSLRRTLLPEPVEYRYISSRFSTARRHPIFGTIRPHYGVDFVASYGTPVRAAGDGQVMYMGWKGENGRLITIRHNGVYRTAYAHLSRYAKGLKRGAWVKQGQVIGYVGNSGSSTGTHLHYGVYRNGRPVDPLKLDYTPAAESVDLAKTPEFQIAWDQARLALNRIEETRVALAGL
jgi:murein DD-endopeptidase MepM/ murein hydrolase activator NlpD